MKDKILAGFLVPALMLAIPLGVLAQDQEATSQDSSSAQSSESLEDRIAERKQRFADRIQTRSLDLISERCQAAQKIVLNALQRQNDVFILRQDKYTQVTAKLNSLAGRLEQQGVEVNSLKDKLSQTQTLIDNFFANFESFITSLDDITSLDCQEDAEGFVAALEDSRDQRATLKSEAEAIKSYVKTEVKEELLAIKSLLEASATQEPATTESSDDEGTQELTPIELESEAQ